MKSARLIKRNSLSERLASEARHASDFPNATAARKVAAKWVRERQERLQVSPRREFAALFRSAG